MNVSEVSVKMIKTRVEEKNCKRWTKYESKLFVALPQIKKETREPPALCMCV